MESVLTLSSLLHLQAKESLEQWCDERGLDHDNDPVETIINYYSYLDELCIPSTTVGSNLVFSNEEVLYTLTSWCKPYLLSVLRSVNKLLSRLISAANATQNDYTADVFSTMCWYHIPKLLTTYDDDVVGMAAERGYELVLPISDQHISYSLLVGRVAESSDCSDKYLNLFIKYYKIASGEDTSYLHVRLALYNSIISGDLRIFKYAFSNMGSFEIRCQYKLIVNTSFYGRLEMIDLLMSLCSIASYNVTMDLLLAAAYCGGHYEEALTHTGERSITKKKICERMFSGLLPKPVSIDLVIDVIDDWVCPEEYVIVEHISGIDYTLEQFKRLWMKVEARFVKREPTNTIILLLSNHRLDVVYYLLSLESYPRDNVRDKIPTYIRRYRKRYICELEKIELLLL